MNKSKIGIIAALIMTLTVMNVYGYFGANETCIAFPQQCDPGGEKSATPALGQLIVDGAAHFLQSTGDFQLFLKKVELSERYPVNVEELQGAIQKAVESMTLANAVYYDLWQMSVPLDYDKTVLEKLREFDYFEYRLKHQLNPSIFQQAEDLLKAGDVKGVYYKLFEDTGKILNRLNRMKAVVDSGAIPKIPDCWRLNQSYLELALFGQYTAEVFITLK